MSSIKWASWSLLSLGCHLWFTLTLLWAQCLAWSGQSPHKAIHCWSKQPCHQNTSRGCESACTTIDHQESTSFPDSPTSTESPRVQPHTCFRRGIMGGGSTSIQPCPCLVLLNWFTPTSLWQPFNSSAVLTARTWAAARRSTWGCSHLWVLGAGRDRSR
jgi:hypothetical protein